MSNRNYGSNRSRRKVATSTLKINQLVRKATPLQPVADSQVELTFDELNLSTNLLPAIKEQGFTKPTPIQVQVIPEVLAGKDVVGIAQTGTGKTASFLLPLLTAIELQPTRRVLVVVPTRELALQIDHELYILTKYLRMRSAVCIGGARIGAQIRDLQNNYQFLIGTPGRIKDLTERGLIDFSKFSTVVLDEMDRMLDMGFVHDVRELMRHLPSQRQALFFSATTSEPVKRLLMELAHQPVFVSIKSRDTADSVNQDVIVVRADQNKKQILTELLEQAEVKKVIIFGRTKRGVNQLSLQLHESGYAVTAIHGNKSQSQRQQALRAFTRNQVNILVATDVAARGIDVPDVTHVINYDLPQTYEDYIHRIGRTGRAGKIGTALTFVNDNMVR